MFTDSMVKFRSCRMVLETFLMALPDTLLERKNRINMGGSGRLGGVGGEERCTELSGEH